MKERGLICNLVTRTSPQIEACGSTTCTNVAFFEVVVLMILFCHLFFYVIDPTYDTLGYAVLK